MQIDNFIKKFRNSIISKIICDTSLTEDKKKTYLENYFGTEYTSKKINKVEENNYVHLPLNVYKYKVVDLINNLSRKYRIKAKGEYLQIHVEDLEGFITEYRTFPTMSAYTLPRIAISHAINWNNDFIIKYADLLSFHYLHRNPKVIGILN